MRCSPTRGSHLDLFDRCELAYRRTVHDRDVPDVKVPRWAALGWLIHEALRDAVELDVPADMTLRSKTRDYREVVRRGWASSYPDVPLDDREIPRLPRSDAARAARMISNFERLRPDLVWDDSAKEAEFIFSYFLDEARSVRVYGTIDLIMTRADGSIRILDYKSGRPRWCSREVPAQLLRYAVALAATRGVPLRSIQAVLVNLESGEAIAKTWSSDEGNEMLGRMLAKVRSIQAVDPKRAAAKTGGHCDTLCQFRSSCRAADAVLR
jgi:choline dehydrogenase-like flavoprotein